MIDTKAKETFWEVVAECLIAIHGFAKPEAHRRSLDLRTRIEDVDVPPWSRQVRARFWEENRVYLV